MTRLIDAAASQAPSQFAELLKKAAPAIKVLARGIMFVWPFYKFLFDQGLRLYKIMPTEVITMFFGLALCFFGGDYYASIAAIEAFRLMGWKRTYENLLVVWGEYQVVKEKSDADDLVDEDGDGVADVDQIHASELFNRKLTLAMTSIKEPTRLQTAIGGVWSSWLAVLASLRMEFARTTAIALGLTEATQVMAVKVLSPILCSLMAKEKHHWVLTIIDTAISLFFVIFCWYLQAIISMFYSGIRGGLLFARTFLPYMAKKRLLPEEYADIDMDDTIIDEMIGYSLATCGFVFQLFSNFTLPFPLNIILLPLTIIEYFIRWEVSFGPATQ